MSELRAFDFLRNKPSSCRNENPNQINTHDLNDRRRKELFYGQHSYYKPPSPKRFPFYYIKYFFLIFIFTLSFIYLIKISFIKTNELLLLRSSISENPSKPIKNIYTTSKKKTEYIKPTSNPIKFSEKKLMKYTNQLSELLDNKKYDEIKTNEKNESIIYYKQSLKNESTIDIKSNSSLQQYEAIKIIANNLSLKLKEKQKFFNKLKNQQKLLYSKSSILESLYKSHKDSRMILINNLNEIKSKSESKRNAEIRITNIRNQIQNENLKLNEFSGKKDEIDIECRMVDNRIEKKKNELFVQRKNMNTLSKRKSKINLEITSFENNKKEKKIRHSSLISRQKIILNNNTSLKANITNIEHEIGILTSKKKEIEIYIKTIDHLSLIVSGIKKAVDISTEELHTLASELKVTERYNIQKNISDSTVNNIANYTGKLRHIPSLYYENIEKEFFNKYLINNKKYSSFKKKKSEIIRDLERLDHLLSKNKKEYSSYMEELGQIEKEIIEIEVILNDKTSLSTLKSSLKSIINEENALEILITHVSKELEELNKKKVLKVSLLNKEKERLIDSELKNKNLKNELTTNIRQVSKIEIDLAKYIEKNSKNINEYRKITEDIEKSRIDITDNEQKMKEIEDDLIRIYKEIDGYNGEIDRLLCMKVRD